MYVKCASWPAFSLGDTVQLRFGFHMTNSREKRGDRFSSEFLVSPLTLWLGIPWRGIVKKEKKKVFFWELNLVSVTFRPCRDALGKTSGGFSQGPLGVWRLLWRTGGGKKRGLSCKKCIWGQHDNILNFFFFWNGFSCVFPLWMKDVGGIVCVCVFFNLRPYMHPCLANWATP